MNKGLLPDGKIPKNGENLLEVTRRTIYIHVCIYESVQNNTLSIQMTKITTNWIPKSKTIKFKHKRIVCPLRKVQRSKNCYNSMTNPCKRMNIWSLDSSIFFFFIFIQFNLTYRKRTQDQNTKWVVCNTSSWFDDVIEVLLQVHLAESRGDPDLDPTL